MNIQANPASSIFAQRSAGILLHPTSLPCTDSYWGADAAQGFGTLGKEAYNFVDFMAAANLSVWQVLPLGPTQKELSPYQCSSVHAGNPELINLGKLVELGWLNAGDLNLEEKSADGVRNLRRRCAPLFFNYLEQSQGAATKRAFDEFCAAQAYWLDDFVLFCALHAHFDHHGWTEWPEEYRRHDAQALAAIKSDLAEDIKVYLFEQFAFATQWRALKSYANQKNIFIFGDMPIFVGHDSADVWAQPHYFKLDGNGNPQVMAGVPPDSFSEGGQCWGNPIYDWDVMQQDGFQWWLGRFRSQAEFFDLIRIDHFRGLEAYWEIPADTKDARTGQWIKAPGEALLSACRNAFPDFILVAENLGMITDEVEELRNKFQLPGMVVLHFAFESDSNSPHLPHHHTAHNIVYTGTHDNNTTLGWEKSLTDTGRQQLHEYSYHSTLPMPWLLIHMALASSCNLAIVPMQDFLGLDENSRMNIPATAEKNWRWKFCWDQVDPGLTGKISQAIKKFHRYSMVGKG